MRVKQFLRAILGLALGTLLSCCTSPSSDELSSAGDEAEAPLSFTEVTTEAGLGKFRHSTGNSGQKWLPESIGSGAGFVDYNGDGWLDIVLVGGGTWEPTGEDTVRGLWLYRNNGDGTFTDVTQQTGLGDLTAYTFGVTAADYDNDGDQDLYVTALHGNLLLRNDGGSFTEVAEPAGVAGESWSTAALFFDADRDGWVDLYVGNYVEWSPEEDVWCSLDGETKAYCTPDVYEGTAGRFYHNDGDGTFTERTADAGFVQSVGKTLGAAAADFNGDQWPDLVVANDRERNLLYENDGDGTFSENGRTSGIAYSQAGRARAGMGVDAADVSNTGETVIFVGNFSNEAIGVFRHAGGGLFLDRSNLSRVARVSMPILTFGLFLFDVDLDGDLDLFAANGHLQEQVRHLNNGISYRQLPHLYVNEGSGTFNEIVRTMQGGLADSLVARGAAYGDYDRDGDLDILITENGGPARLYRNDLSTSANVLRVALEGTRSSRDGIGAHIEASVDTVEIRRRIRTGGSYLSQSEKVATFGWDGYSRVDTLTVHWPSGQVDRFVDVKSNQQITVEEGANRYRSSSLKRW